MAFKKSNAIRRDTLTHLPSFMKFLVIPFMGGNRDPKWIITGYINGKRNYNVNVMKQLYYIMKNVELYKRVMSFKDNFETLRIIDWKGVQRTSDFLRWGTGKIAEEGYYKEIIFIKHIYTDPYYYNLYYNDGNLIRYKHLNLFLENKATAYVPKHIWYEIASINKLRGRSKMKRKDLIKAVLKM